MSAPGVILGGLVGALISYAVTAARIRRLRAAYHQAAWRANHDPLTGLPQRSVATTTVQANLATGTPTTLILVDLDRFKLVNDTHGHQAGDRLLVTVAQRIARWATGHGGLACRLSGDEFLVVVPAAPHTAPPPQLDVAQLLTHVSQPLTVDAAAAATLQVSATAGVATSDPAGAASWPHLLRQADIALYHARDQDLPYTTYRPGMHMPTNATRDEVRLRDQRR